MSYFWHHRPNTRRTKATLLGLVLSTTALGTAACGTGAAAGTSSSGQHLTTVKVSQYAGTENSWLTWVALQKGFFAKNGIDAQLVSVSSGAQDAPALETHSVDIVNMDLLLAAPTLLSKGQKLTLLTGAFLNPWSVIARPGVVPASAVKQGFPASIKALRGKSVSIVAQGSASSFLVSALESAAGLPKGSIKQVPTGLPASALAALQANQLDAIMEIPPADFQAKSKGDSTLFSFREPNSAISAMDPLLGGTLGTTDGSMWAMKSWASSHPKQVTGFRKAMVEASQWMHDPKNFNDVVSVLSQKGMGLPYTGQEAKDYVKAELSDIVAYYSADSAKAWTAFATKYGLLKGNVPYTDWWSSQVPQP